jgi:hypothetical protein
VAGIADPGYSCNKGTKIDRQNRIT